MLFAPAGGEQLDWQNYDRELIEKRVEADKPVLIKFTADWCLSCKMVDKLVYNNEDIIDLLKSRDVLTIKADTTLQNSPATKALKNIYNEPGVPVTILHLPDREKPLKWKSLNFSEELKGKLENI